MIVNNSYDIIKGFYDEHIMFKLSKFKFYILPSLHHLIKIFLYTKLFSCLLTNLNTNI